MSIILASKSPRRREILSAVGLSFTVVTTDTDESCNETDAALLVEELSRRKAEEVQKILVQRRQFHPDDIIIGCDTVVCCDKTVLGKPKDREDAKRMLRLLSGREHRVVSGLTLLTAQKTAVGHEETLVRFDPMSEDDIERYVATGEPDDKAGAYAIQGLAAPYIRGIDGCYYNVVGLPVNLMRRLAAQNGIPLFSR